MSDNITATCFEDRLRVSLVYASKDLDQDLCWACPLRNGCLKYEMKLLFFNIKLEVLSMFLK